MHRIAVELEYRLSRLMEPEFSRSIYPLVTLLMVYFLLISHTDCIEGAASISLTVEGGVSLVGPHCPGTVRLFCEGVDLTILRWRFNHDDLPIISYFPDGSSTTQSIQTVFFMPQLNSLQQNDNLILGNFSSSLTVNASELQSNNITMVSCGDTSVNDFVKVNVTIIEPDVPSNPMITKVTAAYQFGELSRIEVTWTKPDNFCPSHDLPLSYQVNLTDCDSIRVHRSSCTEVNCMTIFNDLTGGTEGFTISIKAENGLGTSDTILYPTIIANEVHQYFTPEVFATEHNQLFGRCTTAEGFIGSTECTVQYTTDSMYRNLSDEITAGLNTEFFILEAPVYNSTYYFLFTVLANNTLEINAIYRIIFIFFGTGTDTGVPGWGVALIVIAVIVLLFVVLTAILLLIRQTHWQAKINFDQGNEFQLDDKSKVQGSTSMTKRSDQESTKHAETEIGLKHRNDNALDNSYEAKPSLEPVDSTTSTSTQTEQSLTLSGEVKEQLLTRTQNPELIKEQPPTQKSELVKAQEHFSLTQDAEGEPEDDSSKASTHQDSTATTNIPNSPPEKTNSVTVCVTGTEILQPEDSKPFTVFKVVVENKTKIAVYKRYREFRRLYDEVKKKYPSEATKFKFPTKRYVGDNFEPDFIKRRQVALDDFIVELMKIEDIQDFEPVKTFLQV